MINRKNTVLAIIFILAIIFLDFTGVFYWPKSIVQLAFSPILKFSRNINFYFSGITSTFFSVSKLKKENQKLKEENLKLLGENSEFKDVKKENDFLRGALDQKINSKNFKLLLAKVISKNPGSVSQEILIDKGERDGIKMGDAVLYETILVGRVSAVYYGTSLVTLVTSNNFKLEVFTEESNLTGVFFGQLKTALLDFIQKDKELHEGELVLASGSDNIPRGILIGKISSFASRPEKIFQDVKIAPLFLEIPLDNVFVLLEY